MATGAILTRKRIISQHVYSSLRSIQSFQGLGYYHRNIKERDENLVTNGELLPHPPKQSTTSPRPYEFTVIGGDRVRSEMFLTMGMRFRPLYIHSASAATAEKPESGNDDMEKGTRAAKTRKEASIEECDQAVEGLSSVKAKAKAKQLTDSQKVAKSILQRARTIIVGSDPALRAIASMSREDWSNKLVHWKHEIKSTLQHYWLGLKLFTIDVRISSRLLLKLNAQYAKFLQDTVKEMAQEVQNPRGGETKKTAEDLAEFFNRVSRGSGVSNDEILGFAKLFNDELTLDNISSIKDDDRLIQSEGLESLCSEAELHEDCGQRGMLELHSVQDMRKQLRNWLDLSFNYSMPSSLFILSRAFTIIGRDPIKRLEESNQEIFFLSIGRDPTASEVKLCGAEVKLSKYTEIALQSVSGAALCGRARLLKLYQHEPFHMFLHGIRSYDSNWKLIVRKAEFSDEEKQIAVHNLAVALKQENLEFFLKNWMPNVLIGIEDIDYWFRAMYKHGAEMTTYALCLDFVFYLRYFTALRDFIQPKQDLLLDLEVDLMENGPVSVRVLREKFRAIFGVRPVIHIKWAVIEKENGKIEEDFIFCQAGFFFDEAGSPMDAWQCKAQLKAPLGHRCTEASIVYFSRKRNRVLRRVLLD